MRCASTAGKMRGVRCTQSSSSSSLITLALYINHPPTHHAAGIIDLRTTPGADDPKAPPTIAAKGLARRAAGYPSAPQLSIAPMERLSAAALPASSGDNAADTSFGVAPVLQGGSVLTPRAPGQQLGAAAITDAAVTGEPSDLQQQQEQQQQLSDKRRRLQGLKDASPRTSLRRRASGTRAGFAAEAPAGAFAGAGAGAAASLAVSADYAVHVTGGAVAVYSLDKSGGARNATLTLIRLQDLFAPVGSSNCRDGVFDAHSVYDPQARRFYLAAACGGTGSALLAASATAEPYGVWYLYNLAADGVGTKLACPKKESTLVDYTRVGFNADAVALTVHTYCPSAGGGVNAAGAGAMVLVLPKGTLARGDTRLPFAVFTSHEVAEAAGDAGLARAILQLEPAMPQQPEDVQQGSMYFVADVSVDWLRVMFGGWFTIVFCTAAAATSLVS